MPISENFRLRLRKDRIWELAWTDSVSGSAKRKSTGTRDKKEAEQKAIQIKADALKKKMSTVPTVSNLIDAYLENMKVRGKPEKSLVTTWVSLRPITDRLGGLRWDQLTQDDIDRYARERLTDTRQGPAAKYTGGTIGPSTVDKDLRTLRAVMREAHARRYIDSEVVFKIHVTPNAPRDVWLTRREIMAMLGACSSDRTTKNLNGKTIVVRRERDRSHIEAFIRIALATGARKEAILSLKWEQVHINHSAEKPALDLYTGAIAKGSYIDFGRGNGTKKRPKVPIGQNQGLMSLLLFGRTPSGVEWVVGDKGKGNEVSDASQYVITYQGKRLADIKKGLAAVAEDAGIKKNITPHTLKHTAITNFITGGMDITTVAMLVNTSEKTLLKHYAHLMPEFEDELGDIASF